MIRTDLAIEAHSFWRKARQNEELPGVRVETKERGDLCTTIVQVLDAQGAKALEKPVGTYYTMALRSRSGTVRTQAADQLAEHLQRLLPENAAQGVMVIGLGNRAVTPDALGPQTVDKLLVTRHLHLPYLRSVAALCPGVLGQTGVESREIVCGVLERTAPACVIVIDALAAAEPENIGTVVQMTNTGIQPGAGVGNRRMEFDEKTLGVPVIAIGVPTVTNLQAAQAGMIVTGADIDAAISGMSRMLASALNRALQPNLTDEDMEALLM